MKGERPEEVVARAQRAYDEGHISSGRLRAIKRSVEADGDVAEPLAQGIQDATAATTRRRRLVRGRS